MSSKCARFFFQAEDGIRDLVRSRGLGDVYKRQIYASTHRIPPKAFFEADEWAHLADWEAELMPHYLSLIHI
mgnify:CR=1 FL=1